MATVSRTTALLTSNSVLRRLHCSAARMADSPVIGCRQGRVKGSISNCLVKGSKAVYTFRNVPYGKPPTGKLRFMPPEPASSWDDVLDCSKAISIPMQSLAVMKSMQFFTPTKSNLRSKDVVMSEDCLRLSVYTPENSMNKRYPVMVWLYGGAFQMGFADIHDGTALSSLCDVVVVVPNYRVGVLGFFSLGIDSECTGNAGLFDQRLALQWVQDNIEQFGGDKYNVTIFGESAGGCSVHHHVNSPLSRGLFHKAISHSGQANLAKLFKRDLSRARKAFLGHLGIGETERGRILDLLQTLPAEDLLLADQKIATQLMAFDPTLDNKFVTKTPGDSLLEKDFNKVPYMIGCNDSEGHGMLTLLAGVPNFMSGMSEDELKNMIPSILPRMSPKATLECQKACLDLYVTDQQDPMRYSKAYGDIFTDSMFVTPAVTTANVHTAAGCPVYLYFGTYQLRLNHDKEYGPRAAQKSPWCKCDHGDDICMMWGVPFCPGRLSGGAKFTNEEVELSRKCMTYITNFATHGDPNVGKPVGVRWPEFSRRGEYLNLQASPKIHRNLAPEKVHFWQKTVFDIAKKDENRIQPRL